jgi:UrcA family protein
MRQTLKIIAVSAIVTAAAIKAVPAFSAPVAPPSVSVVRTADLDLSTPGGRAALDHRLVIAANDVCGAAADVDLSGQNAVRACRADVLAKARRESGQLASRGRSILVAAAR